MGVTLRRWPAERAPPSLQSTPTTTTAKRKNASLHDTTSHLREKRVTVLAFLDGRHQFYITHGPRLAGRTSKHPITEKTGGGLGARIRSVLSQQMVPARQGGRRTDRQAR